jgi:predicted permease
MERLLLDMRFALRSILHSRFVSGLAVVAFALGLGVTTTVFSIFNGVLLEPLPFPHPEELVAVYGTQPTCSTCPASFPKYYDWKTRNHVFSAMGGSTQASFVMTGNGDPVRVTGVSTTSSLVDVFGIQPQIGRWYSEQEDQFGGPKVVVLSYGFWQARFNADRSIVGRKLLLDGDAYEVIGVMPEGFSHRRAEVFLPLQRKLDPATRGNHFLATYARLKQGVTLERATAEMRELGKVLASEYGYNHGIDVRSYFEATVGDVRTPLRILLGVVVLVLLIACANVANLLLASGMARKRELAIRMALGANQKDLARQLAIEAVLLAMSGGALGVLFAQWTIRTFLALAGNQLPRAATVGIDARVLVFSAVISVAVGIFCGLWPLLLLRMKEIAASVRDGESRTSSGSGRRFGSGLVVGEISVALTLLIGAGLLVKDLVLLKGRPAGIRTDRIIAFDIAPSGPRYKNPEQIVAFYRELYSRLGGLGDIESVGMTSHLPMYSYGWNGEFQIEGPTPWDANSAPLVEYRWIYGDYLKTMGIPLLAGRVLDDRDGKDSTAVMINHAMAEKFWPGKDPLAKRFGQGNDTSKWFQVVGVLADVRSYGLTRNSPYEFYRTLDESAFNAMTVAIRTRGDNPAAIIPSVRQLVSAIDPSLPITTVQTMEHVVSESIGRPRLMSALTGLFAALAGFLAMVGVYGVMAYNVRRQRREFGIRLALGAEQGGVTKLVVGRALSLSIAGVLIGGIGAWMLTRLLRTMLNDVRPTDPSVFAGTALAVLLVAVLASYFPARSASRVDPVEVLRES